MTQHRYYTIPAEEPAQQIGTRSQRAAARLGGDGTPTVFGTIGGSFVSPVGRFLKTAVLVLAWLLLAASSFTFGYDFIGAWLFRGWLGDDISRFISGAACLVLFDLAYTSSLISFFRGSRSNAQRAFYGLFFVVPFALGLVASISGFALLSEGVVLDAASAANIRSVGQVAIYAALVNLALYGIVPSAVDPENVQQMLLATIEGKRAEQEQLARLIMENEAQHTYLGTVRSQAHEIGRERGLLATQQFRERWQLPGGNGRGELHTPLDDSGVTLFDLQRRDRLQQDQAAGANFTNGRGGGG